MAVEVKSLPTPLTVSPITQCTVSVSKSVGRSSPWCQRGQCFLFFNKQKPSSDEPPDFPCLFSGIRAGDGSGYSSIHTQRQNEQEQTFISLPRSDIFTHSFIWLSSSLIYSCTAFYTCPCYNMHTIDQLSVKGNWRAWLQCPNKMFLSGIWPLWAVICRSVL